MMTIKQQLSACLKQTAQMEQEAQNLGLAPNHSSQFNTGCICLMN